MFTLSQHTQTSVLESRRGEAAPSDHPERDWKRVMLQRNHKSMQQNSKGNEEVDMFTGAAVPKTGDPVDPQ